VLETAFIKQRVPYQIVRGLAFFEKGLAAHVREGEKTTRPGPAPASAPGTGPKT